MGDRKSFLLRIDADLWAQLERWAQEDLRSVNGQIEYLLRQAVLKRVGQGGTSESSDTSSKSPIRKK
jgi:hypothetical protein